MKKNLLVTFLLTLVGMITAQAGRVMIDVDHAANVIVATNAGNGTTLELQDGMNSFDLIPESDNPLFIAAAPGATVESVTINGSQTATPSGDGNYRIALSDGGMMIQIVTTGGGQTEQNVSLSFVAYGEGVTGSPFDVFHEKDGEWIAAEKDSWGNFLIPKNANVKIVPFDSYEIVSCEAPGFSGEFNGSLQADGSYIFVNTLSDFYMVRINMQVKSNAIRFGLTVDYTPNVECWLENQRGETPWEKLDLISNVRKEFTIEDSQNPLEFIATEGAEIVQVLKNGEVQNPIGWGGSNGWLFVVKNGDEFVVSTKGAPTDVAIEAIEGGAPLESYFFKKIDGTEIPV